MIQEQNNNAKDPKNPASKPHATTQDQIANMENEGQAQQPGQETPAEVQDDLEERKRQEKGNRGPEDVPGFGQGA